MCRVSTHDALRLTFDAEAERYARARPGYPAEAFADLATAIELGPGSRVLEIGPGTGQATRDLARTGATITAVEIGAQLAARARLELAEFRNVEVVPASFEEWHLPSERFDVVFAATSWHWVDPEVRVVKAAKALRPGGVLATLSTHHVAGGSSAFFAAAQGCYERWDPATERGLVLPQASEIGPDPEPLPGELFGAPTFHRYEREVGYSTGEYLDLLMTYSGHIQLSEAQREGLSGCLGDLIEAEYGGRVVKRYLWELRVVRRR